MGISAWVRRRPADEPGDTGVTAAAQGPSRGADRVAAASGDGQFGQAASSPQAARPAGDAAGDAEMGGTSAASAIETMEWPALETAVRDCTRCPLHASRKQGVFGAGNRRADLLIIGEAPGAEEDRRGEPFVGRAGGLLDLMLNAIGLDRQGVYITNILKSRPPENRDPRAEEVAACEPYLRRQIELIEPRVILATGRVAAQNLLDSSQPLGKLRRHWHRYGPRDTPVRVSYHPAYLLRRPADKRKAWHDLRQVRDALSSAAANGVS